MIEDEFDFYNFSEDFKNDYKSWFVTQIENLTDELVILNPSDWAESKRYLPPSVTPMPGHYSFDVSPYLREIVDNFSPYSPIREVTVMKGVQIGFTCGVLENIVGYLIDHIKNAPSMFVTADAELAKLRLESYILPMIHYSGLDDLIRSSDVKSTKKTGRTSKKLEWQGGGFLVPFGAQNANKLRSLSIQWLLEDENDGWPDRVGKSQDPQKDVEDRTAAFEASRKILRGSTPLIKQTSKILPEYEKGDKRKYYVPCKHCGEKQFLSWTGINDDGTVYGFDWKLDDDGNLISDSVVYLCKYCQGPMKNDDKVWMYRESGKHCEWVPTKKPDNPFALSYHLPAFYSPPGMESWESLVRKWLEAWDPELNKPKDTDKLQRVYNNVFGRPYEIKGESLKLERVVMHRRFDYYSGEVPNSLAKKETGSPILFLTCAIDVHKNHLDLQVIGWCKFGRFYSIEWHKFEGDCEDLESEPWQKVRDIVISKAYRADDGKLYRIQSTLIDSQYNHDTVLNFCNEFSSGVFPIQGREFATKTATIKEFSEFTTKTGIPGFHITTTIYKDRLAAAFKREWNEQSLQPDWYPNFPRDYPDIFFKEMIKENKKEIKDNITKQSKGFRWVGVGAHAWDTTVYNTAAHDMIAFNVCQSVLGLEYIDRLKFWELCETQQLFFE